MAAFRLYCSILLFLIPWWASGQSLADPRTIEFRKLTHDIHLAFRPDPLRSWVEGNVVIIVNDRDVVVVDASGSPTAARSVINYIRSVTNHPVSHLINTHGHGDHTIGNQEYVSAFPGIEIIGHEGTHAYISGTGYNYVDEIALSTESRKQRGEEEIAELLSASEAGNDAVISNLVQYYRKDIDIRQAEYKLVTRTPPTRIVNDTLILERGSRTIKILFLGAANTASDLVVFLPKERLVCTGDMVTEPVPYGFSRHPVEWLQTLHRLAVMDFEILVPGHGEVQKGKKYLWKFIRLFESLQEEVSVALQAGLDLQQTRAHIDLRSFKDEFAGSDPVARYYFDEYFSKPAVERMYDGLRHRR